MAKMSTGGSYMAWMQRQTGAAAAGKRRKIGVNASAIRRRKSGVGGRKPVKGGRAKKSHAQPVGPAKHQLNVSPLKNSQRQPKAKASRSRSLSRQSSG
jgi:hypothetical protein